MGLGVESYRQIKRVGDLVDVEPKGNKVFIFINPDFPRYSDGMIKGIYSYEEDDSFRAGSYSGYNTWRARLANMIGHTDTELWDNPVPCPFLELINNSDCDAVIGPITSKKLFEDFKKYQDKLPVPADEGDEWFIEKYNLFMAAFEMASDEGCVVFA